jgi:hypothetical protein
VEPIISILCSVAIKQMALTKMKRAFIAAYCNDPKLGQTEAARKAGCKNRAKITACEWMRDPEVKREIDRQIANKFGAVEGEIVGKKELTADTVIQDLNDIADICKTAGAGAWQAATLVKIAELKGRYLKMFTDRVEFDVSDKLIARLEAGRRNAGLRQLPESIVEEEPAEIEECEAEEKKESIQ